MLRPLDRGALRRLGRDDLDLELGGRLDAVEQRLQAAGVDLAPRTLLHALAADGEPAQCAAPRAVDDLVGGGLDVAFGTDLVDADLAAPDVDAVDRGVPRRVQSAVGVGLDERMRL